MLPRPTACPVAALGLRIGVNLGARRVPAAAGRRGGVADVEGGALPLSCLARLACDDEVAAARGLRRRARDCAC